MTGLLDKGKDIMEFLMSPKGTYGLSTKNSFSFSEI